MMFRAALEHPDFAARDMSRFKRAVYAMAPMPDELIRRCLDGFGCDFALLFGQTEMSPITTLFRPEHQLSHVGAVGTPLTGVQVAIMGPDGELLPPGEPGEIVYRGPRRCRSTCTIPRPPTRRSPTAGSTPATSGASATTACCGSPTAQGRHQDRRRERGVARGRARGLRRRAGVAEVVVVGLPHARWCEAITAVVVPKPGAHIDPDKLIAALKTRLDGYKVPKSVIVADELPRTSTGKIRRTSSVIQHERTTEADHPCSVLSPAIDPRGEAFRSQPRGPARHPRPARRAARARTWPAVASATRQRHRDRGRLLVRERLELLLDPDSPFLELSALAAWGTDFTVGASAWSPASGSSPASNA